MAIIKTNTMALCLAALLLVSAASSSTCHAAPGNIGVEEEEAKKNWVVQCSEIDNCTAASCQAKCTDLGWDKAPCYCGDSGYCCYKHD